jgi:hypothetical protein
MAAVTLLQLAATLSSSEQQTKALQPGALASPISVSARQLQTLVVAALGALYVAPDVAGPPVVVWFDHDGDVAVDIDKTEVALEQGVVLIAVALETVQTGAGQLVVPLVVGTTANAAGLMVMTESRPRGPVALVDRWGDCAVAVAWRGLIDAAHALALQAGVDTSGARLLPGALSTDGKTLTVVPQARHAIDAVAGR